MIRIDEASPVPIYVQVVEAFRREILAGVFPTDHRLPSIRDLALQLKVNPNTIAKAYQELESSGLIYFRRGQGAFASAISQEDRMNTLNQDIAQRFREILAIAAQANLNREDLLAIFHRVAATEQQAGGKGER